MQLILYGRVKKNYTDGNEAKSVLENGVRKAEEWPSKELKNFSKNIHQCWKWQVRSVLLYLPWIMHYLWQAILFKFKHLNLGICLLSFNTGSISPLIRGSLSPFLYWPKDYVFWTQNIDCDILGRTKILLFADWHILAFGWVNK